MHTLDLSTSFKKEVIDITDRISDIVSKGEISSGVAHVFVAHTTAALTTADLDPGTDQDMLDAFEAIVPKLHYRHPHDPSHVGDHILSSIIGTSIHIPFQDKKLLLGTWQRAVLVEFDGPRERKLHVSIIEEILR